jgi:preprotein translocase subunit SecG
MKKLLNKKYLKRFYALFFILIILFLMISTSILSQGRPSSQEMGAAAFYVQETPTSQTEGTSEIGSTDGIVLMGVIIVLLVVVPILLQRKSWSEDK